MLRAQGRRKSVFPALTGIPADATLDFVSGGTNYKITLSDFLAALNVTGSIVQEGDPLAVPVLDTQGTVHNIRNVETGDTSGLQASISAQNGLTLALNAQSSGAGIAVLSNDNKIRRLVAGGGATITLSGDDITIGVAGVTPVSTLTTGIVAFAGGGQVNAVELTTEYNVVETVATLGDSIKLPTAVAETRRTVFNQGAAQLDLYPADADQINGAGANVPLPVNPGATVVLYCYDSVNWSVL